MQFCGFCGKGPFPSSSTLNKHIRHSVNCNEAARQKWGIYSTNIWKNAPGHSEVEQDRAGFPPILEDEETVNMPDISLDNDLLALEDDFINTIGPQPDMVPEKETPPVHHNPLHVTVEHAIDSDKESYYIEQFPAEFGAGAIWGEDIPFFEKVLRKQQESGSSLWGPFEDEDEWDLAKWLIRNVGQNQINSFLKLNVVSSHHFDYERTFNHRCSTGGGTNEAILSHQPGVSEKDRCSANPRGGLDMRCRYFKGKSSE
jgi:hypothetical protein